MRWLSDAAPGTVAEAVRRVAPQLAGRSIEAEPPAGEDDPRWWSSTAVVGGDAVAKFAWSREAAGRIAHEIAVLTALAGEPFLPEVLAASVDPVLLITRRVPGASLFAVAGAIDPDVAGRQLAAFLTALHAPATRARVEAAVAVPEARHGPQHPPPAPELRDRLGAWARPWCDWAGAVLTPARPAVLVHADFHGDNQVWAGDRLRLVVDFETVAVAEPEYDLRGLPAELLPATIDHYERLGGGRLSVARAMAWQVRTVLGDALWRGDAGRAPAVLARSFRAAGLDYPK